jgi:UDP-glucose 4-epimerase
MKILLTGPCGRVGVFAFERLLEKGYQVRGFDIKDFMSFPDGFNKKIVEGWKARDLDFEFIWGDLRNPDDVIKAVKDDVDVVIHYGAITMPNECEDYPDYTWDTNFFGTRNVIDAVRQSPRHPKIIYASSVAAYGIVPRNAPPVKEDHPLRACCTYGATKIAAEKEIQRSGIPYTILRIASASSPSVPHNLAMADKKLQESMAAYVKLTSPGNPFHFVSTHDLTTAVLKCIDNPDSDNRIFNIAGPEGSMTTFGEMFDKLNRSLGAPLLPGV